MDNTPLATPAANGHDGTVGPSDQELLATMGLDMAIDLFCSPDGSAFGVGNFGRGLESVRIGSDRFRNFYRLMRARAQRPVRHPSHVEEVQQTLEALAFERPTREVHLRAAEVGGSVYLDLADEQGRCVEVSSEGWAIRDGCPVPFYRPRCMRPLPVPIDGGSLDDLNELLNVRQDDLQLVTAFILSVLNPSVPAPALILVGEPGSAKTTTARIIKSLVDPSVGSGSPLPANERDLVIAAAQDRALFFDNVTGIGSAASDMLCRVITGAGYRTRKLYTDNEQAVFEVRRPVIITAVHNPVSRVDLASRSLVIEPPSLAGGGRRDEQDMYRELAEKHPAILGAILTLLSKAMAISDVKPLNGDFRMRDFANFAVRVEEAANWSRGSLTSKLAANAVNMRDDLLEANVVATQLEDLAERDPLWMGTAGQLLQRLVATVPPGRAKEFSTSLAHFSRQVMEVAPALRERGIEITQKRTGHARLITVRKVDQGRAGRDAEQDGDAVTPMTPTP